MRAALLATVPVMLASSAEAQRVPGGELSPPSPTRAEKELKEGVKSGARDTRRVVQDFARCIARRDSGRVAKYLDSSTARFSTILGSRAEECLGATAGDESMLSGKADTYRYALAEAFLVRKYREEGPPDPALAQPLQHNVSTSPPGSRGESELGTLSECVVRGAPKETWALLRTDAASPEESVAFKAIQPAMKACVRSGLIVQVPAFYMRGAIANTYYELSKASRSSTGAVR